MAAVGVTLARAVTRLYTSSLSIPVTVSDQFGFTLEMRTSTLVLSALAILGVALLSQWPGLRAVRRLDVARVVRERAA